MVAYLLYEVQVIDYNFTLQQYYGSLSRFINLL